MVAGEWVSLEDLGIEINLDIYDLWLDMFLRDAESGTESSFHFILYQFEEGRITFSIEDCKFSLSMTEDGKLFCEEDWGSGANDQYILIRKVNEI